MTTETFLRGIGFRVDADWLAEVTAAFAKEIESRQAGCASSLRMIPSGLGVPEGPCTGRVAVIDAGGTNLRVAVLDLGAGAEPPRIRSLTKLPMPGTRGKLSADRFHSAIAAPVNALLAADPTLNAIGYCFSYECRTLPHGDAELVAWSKQVEAPEVIGQAVGAELVKRLIRPPQKIRVLNDTVATLLAGRAFSGGKSASGYLGFILGTGTNVAAVESGVIVNAESGEFNKLDRSKADLTLDASLPDTGNGIFEKMVSGAYLGPLGLQLLRLAAREGLFSSETARRLEELPTLTTVELDSFAAGQPSEVPDAAIADADRDAARELAFAVFRRAAGLTAAHLAAFLRRVPASSTRDPVLIAIDGSVYWKTRCLEFDRTVCDLLHGTADLPPFETVGVTEASLIGAGVAASGVCR